ncbi:hypothetical protein [Nocardia colli]|uniref:hypothetical protein n=1 Tax=Nocardia colli TaxID=2545717 RepID=UPI0035DA8E4A
MPIDPKYAFLHVINDYRYLALAARGWKLYGYGADAQDEKKANELLPGIGVVLLDSVLLHSRALIEFYMARSGQPRRGDITDIRLSDFDGLAIDAALWKKIAAYKKGVEVHVLHITSWRDTAYRTGDTLHARPDWDKEATPLVELIFDGLQDVANKAAQAGSKWAKPLSDLHAASRSVLSGPSCDWPVDLAEKSDVTAYLVAHGL